MNRSKSQEAIVLSLRSSGENNTAVTLLTPEDGLIYATLYGGPKSRLRSYVSQWNRGTVWLYQNPEKNQIKIQDFEVKKYHLSFSENLFKFYAASLAAELAIKTRAAGSPSQCFHLVGGFLDGMEVCNEEQSRLGMVRFLWRFLEIMGLQPPVHACGMCGKSFIDAGFANKGKSYYNISENNFICSDCGEGSFSLNNDALQYLAALSVLSPADARKLQIDKEGFEQIKNIIFFLIENSIEQKLNSIESGMGIL
ncbi:MAG: DNA repair protein RecO [Treponema sp.]|nr:DNA repair protein RecO [Treponema sp.]